VAEVEELRRIALRDVGSREVKRLERALSLIETTLEVDERVLGAATGDWFSRRHCLAVATSRKLAVADDRRVEEFPYASMLDVEYTETWRKATLLVRAPGLVADIHGVQQDRARSLHSLIQTARTTVLAR
jgi:hypothetical protein